MDTTNASLTGHDLSSSFNNTNSTNSTDDLYGHPGIDDDSNDNGYDDYVPFGWSSESYFPTPVYLTFLNLVGLLGFVGNGCVLSVMQHASLSSMSYSVYLRFLAVSDMVVLFFRLFESNNFKLDFIDAVLPPTDTVCRISTYFDNWATQLSPWLVVLLTVDRFIAVVYPLQRKSLCIKKNAVIACSVFTVVLGVANAASIPLVIMSPDSFFCSLVEGAQWFDLFTFIAHSILPCILIFVLNMFILHKIRVSSRERESLTTLRKQLGKVAVAVIETNRYQPTDQNPHKTAARQAKASGITEGASVQSVSGSFLTSNDITENSFVDSMIEQTSGSKGSDVAGIAIDPRALDRHDHNRDSLKTNDPFKIITEETNLGNKIVKWNEGEGKTENAKRHGLEQIEDKSQKKSPGSVNAKKPQNKVGRATISLTYVSVSALLTIAPFAFMRGLFIFYIQDYENLMEVNPDAGVPENLLNINRVWEFIELFYLLNFGQNFYVLLATNRQVLKAAKESLCSLCRQK